MDNRSFQAGAAALPPSAPGSPSSGYPTNGNPLTSTLATEPGEYWFHQIGEELRNLIAQAGLTPSNSDLTQLYKALLKIIDGGMSAYSAVATQSAGDFGKLIECGGSSLYTLTLPPVANIGVGASLDYWVTCTGGVTLAASSGNFLFSNGHSVSSLTLSGGSLLSVRWDGNNFVIDNASATAIGNPNQTYQDMTGSRAFGTTYTNTTNAPILCIVYASNSSAGGTGVLTLSINGGTAFTVASQYAPAASLNGVASFIVKPLDTYKVSQTLLPSLVSWIELRG